MPNFNAPGIRIIETDFTNTVPAVASSVGAFIGNFEWGPASKPTFIDSENTLVSVFGRPSSDTAVDFFTLASFLAYGGQAWVVRSTATGTTGHQNARGGLRNIKGTFYPEDVLDGEDIDINLLDNIDDYTSTFTTLTSSQGADSITPIEGTVPVASTVSGANVVSVTVDNAQNVAANAWVDNIIKIVTDIGVQYKTVSENAVKDASDVVAVTLGSNLDGDSVDTEALGRLNYTSEQASNATTSIDAANANVEIYTADQLDIPVHDPIFLARYPGALGNSLQVVICDNSSYDSTNVFGSTDFEDVVGRIPTQTQHVENQVANLAESDRLNYLDEMHIVVVDAGGEFSGIPGTILETFEGVSKAKDARNVSGQSNYWKDVLALRSNYVVAVGDFQVVDSNHGETRGSALRVSNWGSTYQELVNDGHTQGWDPIVPTPSTTSADIVNGFFAAPFSGDAEPGASTNIVITAADIEDELNDTVRFRLSDARSATVDSKQFSDYFGNSAEYEADFLIAGKAEISDVKGMIDLADANGEILAVYSPQFSDVSSGVDSEKADAVLRYKNTDINKNSSYEVMDSGWKYMYDKYNDTYVWVPLCGDTAGLMARVDRLGDPWQSPAGYNRGGILNLVRLAWSPSEASQGRLYASSINSIVTETGFGTRLAGDRTGYNRNSPFREIGVRRLFIQMKKAVGEAARYVLHEPNNEATRARFRAAIEPYLRDIAGRGGTDVVGEVKCDADNNPPQVVENNQFVANVIVVPTRSINFITLEFTAVGSATNFAEIVG